MAPNFARPEPQSLKHTLILAKKNDITPTLRAGFLWLIYLAAGVVDDDIDRSDQIPDLFITDGERFVCNLDATPHTFVVKFLEDFKFSDIKCRYHWSPNKD